MLQPNLSFGIKESLGVPLSHQNSKPIKQGQQVIRFPIEGMTLRDDIVNDTSTNGAAAFTDSKT